MTHDRRLRSIPIVLLIVAPAAIATIDARADDAAAPRLTFAWSAPAECTSENDVRSRVDGILGASSKPHENVDARVVVSKDAASFRAEIQLVSAGQTSTRQIDDTSCDALADAVAFIVALTVDPEAVAPKKPPPKIEAPPPPRKEPEPPRSETPSESRPHRPIYLGASFLLDTATLASLGVGAEIAAGYNPKHAAFEISGTWLSGQDAHLAPGSPQGASEHWLGVGARGCWEIFDSSLDIGPCGGAELGEIFASGFGAAQRTDATVALFRTLIGARAKLHFSRFALKLDAEAAIPFTRPSFVIDNAGTVQHVSAASLRTTFGAEIYF